MRPGLFDIFGEGGGETYMTKLVSTTSHVCTCKAHGSFIYPVETPREGGQVLAEALTIRVELSTIRVPFLH